MYGILEEIKMKRVEIAELYKNAEQFTNGEITVCGWVKTQRASKAIGFLEINDGGCFKGLQVVFEDLVYLFLVE